MITADNKVRFLGIQDSNIYISENFINVPGLFKRYYFDEYNEAAIIV